jgi:predicted MFS family arabinose efflux permease
MIRIGPAGLIAVMFAAQVLGMASFVTFPGLLPQFQREWSLSNAEAGWISGVFFAGFVGAAPFLTAATDRIDPRRIFLAGVAASVLSNIGFAALADGFWSGSLWRCLQGIGFAGTYMPGLRAVSDAVPERLRDRSVAFFMATFTVGTSFSFFVSGIAAETFSWRGVFYLLAAGPFAAVVLGWLFLPRRVSVPAAGRRLEGIAAQLRKPFLLRYFCGYFLHNAESSTMRAFIIGFLAFAAAQQPGGASSSSSLSPTSIAAIVNLLGLPGIVLAGEATRFLKRDRLIGTVMLLSSATGILLGVFAAAPLWVVVSLLLLYGFLVPADASALTAGVVEGADPSRRGAALALHSVFGFTGAFLGPVIFGAALDRAGGEASAAAWIVAFVTLAAMIAVWPAAIGMRRRTMR